jgi:hypothetical protein
MMIQEMNGNGVVLGSGVVAGEEIGGIGEGSIVGEIVGEEII